VRGFLLAGVGPEGWAVEDALARAHAGVAVSYGVHPQLVAELSDGETDRAVRALGDTLAARRPAALGEIGLDGVGDRKATLDRQARAFREQLALARAHELPVVIHVLHAHERALALLRADRLPRAGGVVHSYSGSAELVRDYVALGLHLSFAGPVSNANAKKTRAAAALAPRERLLVETDAPDQTPPAHRPAPNEPAFLITIVKALAELRGEAADDLAAYTEANARTLFGLPE
jgi:TatD DNase family protein